MPRRLATALIACLLLAACGSGGSAKPAGSTGSAAPTVDSTDVWQTQPANTTFSADPGTQQPVFEGTFPAEDGQTRVVAALVAPTDPSTRIYVGQEVGCLSPSGRYTKTPLSGRNVTGSGPQVPILSMLILNSDESGEWTCGSSINVCVPGSCANAGPEGQVSILTDKTAKTGYSVLAVSTPLPDWSQQVRPGDANLPISPGQSGAWRADLTLPDDISEAGLAGTISMTNCITPSYPAECAGVGPHDTQGNAVVRMSVVVSQTSKDGGVCQSYTLTEKDGIVSPFTISWEEHHTQVGFMIRKVLPSTDPSCTHDFSIDMTFEVTKGNGIVVERGTAAAPQSLVVVTPPLPNLILSEIDGGTA